MMTGMHLSDGTLRALADHELALIARLVCSAHLARCVRCRGTLEATRAEVRRTHELLSILERPVDTEEGWYRVTGSLPGAGTSARRPSGARSVWLAWGVAAMLAFVAGVLAIERVDGGPSVAVSGAGHQDVCCWDLDGGGLSDDGVMTVSRAGELLDCVVLYDDIDRSRSFTGSDAIRYISRPESCGPLAELDPRHDHAAELLAMSTGDR